MTIADTKSGHVCRDHGDAPDCVGEADPRYTMDFTDVEPGAYIYWCSVCGPRANAIDAALQSAMKNRPGFTEQLEKAIEEHEPS